MRRRSRKWTSTTTMRCERKRNVLYVGQGNADKDQDSSRGQAKLEYSCTTVLTVLHRSQDTVKYTAAQLRARSRTLVFKRSTYNFILSNLARVDRMWVLLLHVLITERAPRRRRRRRALRLAALGLASRLSCRTVNAQLGRVAAASSPPTSRESSLSPAERPLPRPVRSAFGSVTSA